MSPKVSVIIPIYNTEKYLRECLDSVYNQTLRDWECICVDDGSTDNSGAIAEEYATRDFRFRIFHKENGGQSSARNFGIERATGEYIYYLDSDDSIDVYAMELLYDKAKKENLDLLLFDIEDIVYENDELIKNSSVEFMRLETYETCTGREMFLQMVKNGDYLVNVVLQFIKRSYAIESGLRFVEGMIHEDIIYTFYNMINAPLAGYLNKRLYKRRVRPDSTITIETTPYHFWSMFKCYMETLRYAMRTDDEDMKEALRIRCAVIHKVCKNKYLAIAGKTLTEQDAERINALAPIERTLLHQFGFVFKKIYQFPREKVQPGSKIVLYGAGDVGKDYYEQIVKSKECELVLWTDGNYNKLQEEGVPVSAPKEIIGKQYDYILIAMVRRRDAEKIKATLIQWGVEEEKIIWTSPQYLLG